jgi:lambda repressor-like predicted transcriptional regulator
MESTSMYRHVQTMSREDVVARMKEVKLELRELNRENGQLSDRLWDIDQAEAEAYLARHAAQPPLSGMEAT